MVCSLGEMSARGGLFTRGAENAKYYKLNTSIYTSLCIVMNKDNLCKTYIYRSHNMTTISLTYMHACNLTTQLSK